MHGFGVWYKTLLVYLYLILVYLSFAINSTYLIKLSLSEVLTMLTNSSSMDLDRILVFL